MRDAVRAKETIGGGEIGVAEIAMVGTVVHHGGAGAGAGDWGRHISYF